MSSAFLHVMRQSERHSSREIQSKEILLLFFYFVYARITKPPFFIFGPPNIGLLLFFSFIVNNGTLPVWSRLRAEM